MRSFPSAVTVALLSCTALVAVGGPALAHPAPNNGTPTCVTRAEFQQVNLGMTRAKVHQIFGTDGWLTFSLPLAGHLYTTREYRPCPANSFVSVSYTDSHETSKTAIWG